MCPAHGLISLKRTFYSIRDPPISEQLIKTRSKDHLSELTRTKSNGPNPENEFHIEINSLKNIEMSEFTVTKYSVLSKPVLTKYQSPNLVYTVSYRTYFRTRVQRLRVQRWTAAMVRGSLVSTRREVKISRCLS